MKKTLVFLALVLSFTAFADEKATELNAEKVSINASKATVLRTNKTPKSVEITFLVPMANTVCDRYDTRIVVKADAARCGQDVYVRRVPAGRVCVRKNPYNQECLAWQDAFREETVYHPRTCPVPEQYCAQYGTATSFQKDTMKITFKNLPALGDSESESFQIAAQQKRKDGENVIYDVTPVQTLRDYKVTQKKVLWMKIDSYVVEEK